MPDLKNTLTVSWYNYDILFIWIVRSENVKYCLVSKMNEELAIISWILFYNSIQPILIITWKDFFSSIIVCESGIEAEWEV